jgi:hypothetical protein
VYAENLRNALRGEGVVVAIQECLRDDGQDWTGVVGDVVREWEAR